MAKATKTKYNIYRTILIAFVVITLLYFFQVIFEIQDGTREDIGISVFIFAILLFFTYGINGRVKQIKEDLK